MRLLTSEADELLPHAQPPHLHLTYGLLAKSPAYTSSGLLRPHSPCQGGVHVKLLF